jgi:hypothetical protein
LARSGHLDVIVKIVKIAEAEGKEDEKVIFYKLLVPSALIFERHLRSV